MINTIKAYYNNDFKLHRDESGTHPECPGRLNYALDGITSISKSLLVNYEITIDENEAIELLSRIHDKDYISHIKNESFSGYHYIDSDTYVNEHTYYVALKAFTISYEAAKDSVNNDVPIIVLTRPPGHHAGISGRALGAPSNGFCIFNNCAAAVLGFKDLGLSKVLIIDFDAHHGNGTQEIFWNDERVVHIDVHEHGIYPGTGSIKDLGGDKARGTKINVPVPPFSDDSVIAWFLTDVVERVISKLLPDAIAVSAGFDGHELDPLTDLEYSNISYALIGYFLRRVIEEYRVKGLVITLEGGYSVGLKTGIAEFIKAFLSPNERLDRLLSRLSRDCKARYAVLVNEVSRIIERYW